MVGGDCFVWIHPGREEIEITLISPAFATRNLNRPKSELLSRSLQRLSLTLNSKKDKTKRQRTGGEGKGAPEPAVDVRLVDGSGAPVPPETENAAAWAAGRVLHVGESPLTVFLNAPRIRLELPGGPVWTGCPITPFVATTHSIEDLGTCRWLWYRLPADVVTTNHSVTGDMFVLGDPGAMVPVSDRRVYVPSPEDIGSRLCVAVVPMARGLDGTEVPGPRFQCVAASPVAPFPTEDALLRPLFDRSAATPARLPAPGLRVLCYNLLADCYTGTAFARTTLFAHCPPAYLDGAYRRHLAIREVARYNADVLCFQEMGRTVFEQHYSPLLEGQGFAGVLDEKSGTPKGAAQLEGSATFWRTDRLTLQSHHRLLLQELVRASPDLRDLETRCPAAWEVLTKVSTVAQVTILRDAAITDGRLLAVVNTHLFFHPSAPHIRALQAAVILHEVHRLLGGGGGSGVDQAAVVFCGDFNAMPRDGAVEFVRTDGCRPTAKRGGWGGRSGGARGRTSSTSSKGPRQKRRSRMRRPRARRPNPLQRPRAVSVRANPTSPWTSSTPSPGCRAHTPRSRGGSRTTPTLSPASRGRWTTCSSTPNTWRRWPWSPSSPRP
jgi:2',5'-phosphodiesterase